MFVFNYLRLLSITRIRSGTCIFELITFMITGMNVGYCRNFSPNSVSQRFASFCRIPMGYSPCNQHNELAIAYIGWSMLASYSTASKTHHCISTYRTCFMDFHTFLNCCLHQTVHGLLIFCHFYMNCRSHKIETTIRKKIISSI